MKNKIIIVLSLLLMIVSGYFGREWVIKTNNTQAKFKIHISNRLFLFLDQVQLLTVLIV